MGIESRPNTAEKEPKLVARITLSRHEETQYTGIGRDISPEGEERAREKGRQIAKEKGPPVLYGHSPRERAKGTAEAIAEGVKDVAEGGEARWMTFPGLRSTDFHDKDFHQSLIDEWGTTQEPWIRAHYHEQRFYDNPEKIETNEEKRERLYRELDRITAFLNKKDLGEEVPHLVLVSHYEVITLLLDDVFGIQELGSINSPGFGEHVDLDVYQSLENGDVPMRVHYNGKEAHVVFNKKLRRVVAT